MTYYFSNPLDLPFDGAVAITTETLKKHGFGVLTDINVRETQKKKLDVNVRAYRILGACNPKMAHKALQAESTIGTMLPCNVIVQQLENGQVEVSAVDPIASMQAIRNAELGEVAGRSKACCSRLSANLAPVWRRLTRNVLAGPTEDGAAEANCSDDDYLVGIGPNGFLAPRKGMHRSRT